MKLEVNETQALPSLASAIVPSTEETLTDRNSCWHAHIISLEPDKKTLGKNLAGIQLSFMDKKT